MAKLSPEQKIANEIMKNVKKLQLPLELDQLTEGKGDCFPLAVLAQCRRPIIYRKLTEHVKQVVLKNDPTLLRLALKAFILNSKERLVSALKQNYEDVVQNIDGRTWNQYWGLMSKRYEWVDHMFIQATAWFLNNDIMITMTNSPENTPYVTISGNLKDENVPCHEAPLIIGCKPNVHYQSLIPTSSWKINKSTTMEDNTKFDDLEQFGIKKMLMDEGKERQDIDGYNERNVRQDYIKEFDKVATFQYKDFNKTLQFDIMQNGEVKCALCRRKFRVILNHLMQSH